MKMLKKFPQPLKNYTFFHEIYTPTIWTVYDRKCNARILRGILATAYPLPGCRTSTDIFTAQKSIESTPLELLSSKTKSFKPWSTSSMSCAVKNSHCFHFPLKVHICNRLPVTRTFYNSNLPLTWSNYHFPSDHFPYNFTPDNSKVSLFPLKVRIIGSQQQQQHKLYLHDDKYLVTVLQKL